MTVHARLWASHGSSTTRTRVGRTSPISRSSHAPISDTPYSCAPRGRRRLQARESVPGIALAEEGVVIPPTRLDDASFESLVVMDAESRRAARRPFARSSPADHLAERGSPGSVLGPGLGRRSDGGAPRVLGARRRALASASSRRTLRGCRRARDTDWQARPLSGGDGPRRLDRHRLRPAPRLSTGNLNCPLAVTRSACFYVVAASPSPDLPASGGAFEPVRIRRASRGVS